LGTDTLGRDILVRVLHATRVSLGLAVSAVAVAAVVGSLLGFLAGYLRRRVDLVLMFCMDILLAFPATLLAIAIVAMIGPGLRNSLFAISLVSIPAYARLSRGAVLALRNQEVVLEARALAGGGACGGPGSAASRGSCAWCSCATCAAAASAMRASRAWASEDGRALPQRAPVALEEGIVPDTHRVMVGGREVGDLEVRPPEPGHAAGDPGDAAADDDTGAVEGSREDPDGLRVVPVQAGDVATDDARVRALGLDGPV